MLQPVETFWMVWGPRGGQPRCRHATRLEAEAEAARLAERFHGRHFYVLECLGFAMVGEPTLTKRQQERLAEKNAEQPLVEA